MSNKELYGEIFTPFSLIAQMCNLLPDHVWTDPSLTWLDPGCGPGMFSIHIYLRLFNSLHIRSTYYQKHASYGRD